MKKLNKKGFTIVELVIVIAVIGILAAVLIPTFSGVVSKANQSAALQVATSTMKYTLAMSDYGTISEGTYFVVDGMGSNGYQFQYKNNKIEAVETAINEVNYAVSNDENAINYNSIVVNTDLIDNSGFKQGSAKVQAIIEAALNVGTGDGKNGYSIEAAPAGKLYKIVYNVFIKDSTPKTQGAAGVYQLEDGKYTEKTDGDLTGATYTKITWHVYTNSDYATNVVTFTYSN